MRISIPALAALIFLLIPLQLAAKSAPADKATLNEQRRQQVEAMYDSYKRDFPDAPDISAEDALRLVRQGVSVQFVDRRSAPEQAVSILPGAITSEQFLADPWKYKDDVVVAYCTTGYRSGRFTQSLKKRGLNIVNMRGGLLAWAHAGGTFVDASGREVRKAHVYGSAWDLMPIDFTSVEED